MKPESRFERAVFAARSHVTMRTLLSDAAIADVCAELLRLVEERTHPPIETAK